MKMTRFAAAAVLALASAGSFAASLGNFSLATGSATYGNTPIAGGFVDSLTFMLTSDSIFNGSVTTVLNGAQDVDFTAIFLTGPSGVFAYTQLLGDPVEVWATPGAGFSLLAGTYTLNLIGVNSPGMGSYAGDLAVTPVPEPQPLAMLMAGLGVVGLLASRRSKS